MHSMSNLFKLSAHCFRIDSGFPLGANPFAVTSIPNFVAITKFSLPYFLSALPINSSFISPVSAFMYRKAVSRKFIPNSKAFQIVLIFSSSETTSPDL